MAASTRSKRKLADIVNNSDDTSEKDARPRIKNTSKTNKKIKVEKTPPTPDTARIAIEHWYVNSLFENQIG